MRVAFFHGLESPPVSDKTEWLDKNYEEVYAPAMDYRDPGLFDQVLKEIKDRKIDLLSGSSMGGWFAYCLSTLTGIPTVLFNPAFHSRSFDPNVHLGGRSARHRVVLGKKDDVIDLSITQEWIKKSGIGEFDVRIESNDHRTPLRVFSKHMRGLNENKIVMKQHIKLFEEWLTEGGWATVKTQETVIRPQIIKDAVKKIQVIAAELNAHYRSLQMPELDFTQPIGSGTWYEEDLVSQPDKVYGDVDFMVIYPVIRLTEKSERDDEIATVKLYNREMLDFLEKKRYAFIDVTETRAISSDSSVKFVMEVDTTEGEGWIQVDLVVTHTGYRDWAIFRMTPIRNVKGFVLGNLYSSFGKVLELSIQPRGVRAKFIGTQMVALAKRKDTQEILVSRDINTFMSDIARFFWEQSGKDSPYEESLSRLS